MKKETETIIHIFIGVTIMFIYCIWLVSQGVNAEYVGLFTSVVVISLGLMFKLNLFKKYVKMREKHKLNNRKSIFGE